jgi:DNA polymerase-3 subunit beta
MHIAHTTISDLVTALGHVIPAVPPKSTLFVLEHILLDADGDMLELTATDTELAITAKLAAHITSSGKVLVPARKFYDIARALPDDASCELALSDSFIVIKTASGHYRLPTLDAGEFPELPRAEHAQTVTISASDAQLIATSVAYAATTEQYRPAMTGVKFEIGSEFVAVATDGYRLATVSMPVGSSGSQIEAIVPARVVELLAKAESDVTIGLGKTHALIESDGQRIVTRLIDEAYPQWRNVLPSSSDKFATLDRQVLLKALRRVALLASNTSQLVRFRFDGTNLVLIVTDADTGAHAEEALECEYTGEPIEIGFNSKYIIEALAHLPSQRVTMAMTAPSRAALITPAEQMPVSIAKLVMPMRIG